MEYFEDIDDIFSLNGWESGFTGDPLPFEKNLLSAATRYIWLKSKDIDSTFPARCYQIGRSQIKGLLEPVSNSNEELRIVYESPIDLEADTLAILEQVEDASSKWTCLKGAPFPVSEMLSKKYRTLCFVNRDIHRSIVMTTTPYDTKDSEWFQSLVACLFRLLPWRFPNGLDDDDIKYFKGFCNATKASLTESASVEKALLAKTKFHEHCLQSIAENIVKGTSEGVIRGLRQQEEQLSNDIRSFALQYAQKSKELRLCKEKINSLLIGEYSNSEEIVNGLKNKSVSVLAYDRAYHTVKISICDTLEYYDEDEFRRIKQRAGSYYRQFSPASKAVLEAIFEKKLGVLRVCSVFTLSDSVMKGEPGDYPSRLQSVALPHPHITGFGCLGGNSLPIEEFMANGEVDAAIQQAVAATKNINFADSTVIERFAKKTIPESWTTCKCVITNEGEEMTLKKFYETYCTNNAKQDDTTEDIPLF